MWAHDRKMLPAREPTVAPHAKHGRPLPAVPADQLASLPSASAVAQLELELEGLLRELPLLAPCCCAPAQPPLGVAAVTAAAAAAEAVAAAAVAVAVAVAPCELHTSIARCGKAAVCRTTPCNHAPRVPLLIAGHGEPASEVSVH